MSRSIQLPVYWLAASQVKQLPQPVCHNSNIRRERSVFVTWIGQRGRGRPAWSWQRVAHAAGQPAVSGCCAHGIRLVDAAALAFQVTLQGSLTWPGVQSQQTAQSTLPLLLPLLSTVLPSIINAVLPC